MSFEARTGQERLANLTLFDTAGLEGSRYGAEKCSSNAVLPGAAFDENHRVHSVSICSGWLRGSHLVAICVALFD